MSEYWVIYLKNGKKLKSKKYQLLRHEADYVYVVEPAVYNDKDGKPLKKMQAPIEHWIINKDMFAYAEYKKVK